MLAPDTLPLWFAVPAIVAAWTALISMAVCDTAPDLYPEDLSRLDVLDRTG